MQVHVCRYVYLLVEVQVHVLVIKLCTPITITCTYRSWTCCTCTFSTCNCDQVQVLENVGTMRTKILSTCRKIMNSLSFISFFGEVRLKIKGCHSRLHVIKIFSMVSKQLIFFHTELQRKILIPVCDHLYPQNPSIQRKSQDKLSWYFLWICRVGSW